MDDDVRIYVIDRTADSSDRTEYFHQMYNIRYDSEIVDLCAKVKDESKDR